MKAIFLVVVVLLFGFSSAQQKPCNDTPTQLSGRLIVILMPKKGDSSKLDMNINLDTKLQMLHAELVTDSGPIYIIEDYEGDKTYSIYSGECIVSSGYDRLAPDPTDLKTMKFEAAGKLGMKDASVAVYSGQKDGDNIIELAETSNQCVPVSFVLMFKGMVTAGSFLDLKTTADTDKLKIPEYCAQAAIDKRSIVPGINIKNLQIAMKRAFSWIQWQRVQ